MRAVATIAFIASFTATAAAAPADLVIAANHPFMWSDKTSIAGSAYVGFSTHHAVRLNVATYRPGIGEGVASIPAILSGEDDGDEALLRGRTTDVGISYVYFPDALWRHLFAEVGLMRREVHRYTEDEFASPEVEQNDAIGYAARIHVGWSWLFSDHVFMAAAVGMSGGRYVGATATQQTAWDPMSPTMNVTYNHYEVAAEGYLRFGVRFGL